MHDIDEGRGNAAIVAPQPEAVDVGCEILRSGGNAADAAVAAMLAQTVVDPLMCGIAGFGTMLVSTGSRRTVTALDFHARAGSGCRPDQWAGKAEADGGAYFSHVDGHANELGYQAICVPGTMMGIGALHRRFGSLPFAELAAPAIALAEEGFLVRPFMHSAWVNDDDAAGSLPLARKLAESRTGRTLFFRDDGSLKRIGDVFLNPDYAATLRRIATAGWTDFYRGDLANEIAGDLAAGGSAVSADDLCGFTVQEAAPVVAKVWDSHIVSAPPPGGGYTVLQALAQAERSLPRDLGFNSPDYLESLASLLKQASGTRGASQVDPDFFPNSGAEILSAIRSGTHPAGSADGASPEYPHTTHLAVADAQGMAVSVTHSLGTPSGVITGGLGFMYNGAMSGFDPRPGQPLSIAAGKRRQSALAPTMAFRGNSLWVTLGAPGGGHISNAIVQALLNVLVFDMTMQEAVSAPRVSWSGGELLLSNRIERRIERELAARGWNVRRVAQSFAFAGVHGLKRHDKTWHGGADPQRDGMCLTVESK